MPGVARIAIRGTHSGAERPTPAADMTAASAVMLARRIAQRAASHDRAS